LEQYVRDNGKLFDEEPAAGHFERLQGKISRESRKTLALRWSAFIAASIMAAIVWQYAARQTSMPVVCENAGDMKGCYLSKMNDVAGRIATLTEDFDPWERQQVMSNVQEILDAVNGDFESEIPEELPDDKARAILSDYYRRNLEGLEMIQQTITN